MDKMGTDRKNQNDGNGRFSALTKYIDIFDGDNFGTWVIDHENDGTPEHPVHMPFVDYSQDVHQFIKDFGDFSEQNEDFRLTRYAHILEENGLSGSRKSMQDADVSVGGVLVKITAFLLLMALLGLVLYKFHDFIDANARKQRITTYVVAACLLIAFASEYFFGVADITGAYLLGLFLSRNEIREEVESNSQLIEQYCGARPTVMRPVGGAYDEKVQAVMKELGLPIINWEVDTLDWKTKTNPDSVKQNILDQVHDGSIVLMHDLYTGTIEGVLAAIDELQSRTDKTYAFVTVSELAAVKGVSLEPGQVYTNIE